MSPVEFYELPQGVPSVVPVDVTGTAVAYCSASDVASLNKARLIGQANNPTLTDVNGYILMIAGQMDAIMVGKGYQVPVNTASYPETEGFLGWVNAQGAAWLLEDSSPAPRTDVVDRLQKAYDNAIGMLESAKFVMNLPVDDARTKPRAPWITYQPTGDTFDPTQVFGAQGDGISGSGGRTGNPRNAYLSRQLRF